MIIVLASSSSNHSSRNKLKSETCSHFPFCYRCVLPLLRLRAPTREEKRSNRRRSGTSTEEAGGGWWGRTVIVSSDACVETVTASLLARWGHRKYAVWGHVNGTVKINDLFSPSVSNFITDATKRRAMPSDKVLRTATQPLTQERWGVQVVIEMKIAMCFDAVEITKRADKSTSHESESRFAWSHWRCFWVIRIWKKVHTGAWETWSQVSARQTEAAATAGGPGGGTDRGGTDRGGTDTGGTDRGGRRHLHSQSLMHKRDQVTTCTSWNKWAIKIHQWIHENVCGKPDVCGQICDAKTLN